MGGFRHEPKGLFERVVHHRLAFPIVSVLGGVILVAGIFFGAQGAGNSSRTRAQRPGDAAVRGATAPASANDVNISPTPAAAVSPTGTPGPQRSYGAAPPFSIDPSASYLATIKTEKGDVVVQLDARAAPQTVNNFVFLAQNRFYDGLSFHRVVPGYIAQAGSPLADGSGGPGYTISDENSPLKHDIGAVAMAESGTGSNSAGSQFYVALAPNPTQDGKDTVFGKVSSGLDILQQLPRRDPKDSNGPAPLKIETITITKQ